MAMIFFLFVCCAIIYADIRVNCKDALNMIEE